MAFQIKNFASIAASLINYVKGTTNKVSDFAVGSVARTLLEAPAIEIEELYLQMFNGLNEAIPVSMYTSMDFAALPAIAASNSVRVTVTSSTASQTIPAGTVFAATGQPVSYVSAVDAIIPPSSTYIDITVTAQLPGTVGNISASQVFTLQPSPAGFVSATNLAAFINGVDAETDNNRKLRFTAYIQSLPRGTIAALSYGLKTTALYDAGGNISERVASVAIIEPYVLDNTQPVALVNCYVHNGVGATSGALVTQAAQVVYGYTDANGVLVPGWKAAGVKVNVYAATEQLVAFTGTLTIVSGYARATVVAAATSAVASYLLGLPIGATALLSKMIQVVMETDGVANIVSTAPAADVPAAASTKLMPGVMTFN